MDSAGFLSLSKKGELSNVAIRSNKHRNDDDSSVDQLLAEVNSGVVVEVLVGDIDEDVARTEAIFKGVKVLAVEVSEVLNLSVVGRESLDDWLVDGAQETTSFDGLDCLREFKRRKSRVGHISVVGDSDSVA